MLTDENVLIGGFIISGSEPKKVIIRAIGPSVKTAEGEPLAGRLEDPFPELYAAGISEPIATNNNWKETQQGEIQARSLNEAGVPNALRIPRSS